MLLVPEGSLFCVSEAKQGLLWFKARLLVGQCWSKLGSFCRSRGAAVLRYVETEPQRCCMFAAMEQSLERLACWRSGVQVAGLTTT